MSGRRQNLAFRNGLFQDLPSITIRADRVRLLNRIISVYSTFERGKNA